ncbi:cytochrome P450 2B4-like isoform X1 [Polypterus senegalus]|uniref:cytochrome P450 2B4-like isoform X1 n=2 Tax=Polypterus senegalus TaxID=55291 RepID=UPI00196400D7|nr:cytochrome P450 2B4-like isoform X1 [Polypterus senegalus]
MDIVYTLILTVTVLGLLFILFRRDSACRGKMPPGPIPLPLIGNLLQLNSSAPYESLLKLSETYGPVMTVHLGGLRVVVLVGYETVEEALVQHAEAFAGRPKLPLFHAVSSGFGLINSNGDDWREVRRFSLTTLRDFGMGKHSIEEYIQEEAQHLVENLRKTKGSPCDPTVFLTPAVSNIICSIMFGKRFEYSDENFAHLLDIINKFTYLFSCTSVQMYNIFPKLVSFVPGPLKSTLDLHAEFMQFLAKVVEEHRETLCADSPRDYIDMFLIKMKQEMNNPETPFHHTNLLQSLLDLFLAATETTRTTLQFALLILIKYPHIQEKIKKEIDEVIGHQRSPTMVDRRKMPYMCAVMHEIQRLGDLVPMCVPHATTEDTHFRGYVIPEGTMVMPLLHSVLHDKIHFKSPYSFDPGHFLDDNGCFKMNPAFIPFSTGKRVCLGEGLAQMELFLFLSTLLQNLSVMATVDPESLSLLPRASSFIKVPQHYKILVSPR